MGTSVKNSCQYYVLSFFLATSLGLAARAQAQTAPDAGSLQREAERTQIRKPGDIPATEVETRPADSGGPKLPVTQFIFAGNTLLSDAQLQAVVEPWRDRSLSLEELQAVTGKIAEAYRSEGYLARVVLPQQNIQNGRIQIAVVEARFGTVRMPADVEALRADGNFIERSLTARQKPGDFLNILDVERAALILNDTPGIRVKPVLVAGDTVGHTDIGVEAGDGPLLSGLVSLDNYGSRSTGRARLTPVLKIANPSGIGDEAQFIGLLSEGNLYGRARYSRPIGYDGLRLGASLSYLTYELGEEFEILEAEGSAASFGLDASYPLIREKNRNLRLLGGISRKTYDNEQFGESISEKTINVLNLGISGDRLDSVHGGGITFYGAELSAGDLDLSDNPINQMQDRLGPETEGDYGKLTFSLARLQRLFTNTNLWLSLNGQVSSKNLDSSESFSLGGISGVRAYPILEASGDDGWLFTAELRHNLRPNLTLIPFIDYGQAIERSTQLRGKDTHDLKGVGVGIDWTYADDIAVRASVARRIGTNPLRDPVTGRDSDGSYHRWPVWVSVAKYF